MPSHEYICDQGHKSLVTQSIKDPVRTEVLCEICGSPAKYNWSTKRVAGRVSGGTGGGRKLGYNQKKKEKKD